MDGLAVEPDPDLSNQGLFLAVVGLPDCQGWAWGFEEGAFALKAVPEEAGKKEEEINSKKS